MRALSRALLSLCLFSTVATTVHAQSDTVTPPRALFTGDDAALAAGFLALAYGAAPLDKYFAQRIQNPRAHENEFLRKTSVVVRNTAVPGGLIIGSSLFVIGRATKSHHLTDLGVHGTEAILVGEVLGGVLKGVFGRQRPYVDTTMNPYNWQFLRGFREGDGYRSFPSGHSVAAFAAAAAVTAEMSRWYPSTRWIVGTAMYGGAATVGISRMYDNRHWASDVLVGAAIGTFAGNKVVRYHHSHPGNRIDEWLVNFSLAPTPTGHVLHASILPSFRRR